MSQAIGEKVREQKDLQKQGQEIQLELKELDHKINKFQRDSKDAATKVCCSWSSLSYQLKIRFLKPAELDDRGAWL